MLKGISTQLEVVFSNQKRPAYARHRAVYLILCLTIPVGIIFSFLNYMAANYRLAVVESFVMIFLTPVFWLVKKDKHINLSENIVMVAAVIIFSALYITGGKGGAGSNWIFIYPFVAFYINDQQKAWKWITLFILILLVYTTVAKMGYVYAYYSIEQLVLFQFTFLFYTFLAYHFNSLRNQYDNRLEAQVNKQTKKLQRNVEKFKQHALFDTLTGLPNRRLFEDRLEQALKISEREKDSLCVAVIDLDRFQEINNVMGHDKGDEVLQQMGQRITGKTRVSDTIARVGGDTFALILPKATQETAYTVTQKIISAMNEPFVIQDYKIELSIHIGVAVAPLHGNQPSILLQRADLAMRQAKEDHMDMAVIYDQKKDPYSFRKLVLVGKLRKAVTNGNLTLVFQPKIGLDTLRIVGVEALIRWFDEEEGFISPAEFIPMAEQTGIINRITEWVLEEAARQAAIWKKAGYSIPIAVNLSPRNLLNSTLLKDTEALLARNGLNSDDISIEVTETALMTRPDKALTALTSLHNIGIHLSIDDFGTGYSSLAYLKSLPVDELKIDQCFIFSMLENKADMMIVKSTVELAHGFGLSVVAEGVEEEAVLHALKEMGVDKAQGYFMSRPLAATDLQTWLVESKWGLEMSPSGKPKQAKE
jgi:diguanylate cyclase (GGDEF)-like protein